MPTRFLVPLGLLLALAGCKTVPLPEPIEIEVPASLTAQQVELAILSGILNKRPPANYDPRVGLPEAEFQSLVWDHYLQSASARSWFPESREPGYVVAAVSARRHYLRVGISFDTRVITIRILESRNLLQSSGRIHKRVPLWLERLNEHIRRELGRMSFASRSAA